MTGKIRISGAQLAALFRIGHSASNNPNRTIVLEQTETAGGAAHLYARIQSKYVHVSAGGNAVELEP